MGLIWYARRSAVRAAKRMVLASEVGGMHRSAALMLAVALLGSGCGGTVAPSRPPTPPPTSQSTPSATADTGCPSVATNEGADPEPEAPPDDAGTLSNRGREEQPQESQFVAASEDSLWVTSPAGKLWRIDAGTGMVMTTVDLPDLGLARPLIAHGSVWLAEMSSGRLLRLDPADGSIASSVDLDAGERPMALAATAGTVLVANQTTNTLTFVDAERLDVTAQIDLSSAAPGAADRAPAAVVVDGETAWVVEHRADALARVNLGDNSVTRTCLGDPEAGQVVAAAGRLWVASAGGVVSIVDPGSGEVTARLGLPAVTAGDLTVDGETVWVGAGSHVIGIDTVADQVSVVAATGELSDLRQFPGGVAVAVTSESVWTTDPAGFGLLEFAKGAP